MREVLAVSFVALALAACAWVSSLAVPASAQEPPKEPAVPPKAPPKADPLPEKNTDPVEGGYTVASGERDGMPIPPEELKDALVRFSLGEVTGTYKNLLYFLADTYSVDITKTPWKIEMKSIIPPGVTNKALWKQQTVTGLIKKERGYVTLIYSLPGFPAPTEFKTKQGQVMYVLQGFYLGEQPPNKFANLP